MHIRSFILALLCLTYLFVGMNTSSFACSMFKMTINGKTYVGNNEDAWSTNPHIWFENGSKDQYGVAYVGHIQNFPQGGMNTASLTYDAFSLYAKDVVNVEDRKKDPGNSVHFLKRIMQTCSSVEEVKTLIQDYDISFWNKALFMFVDKTGKYLLVEVDTMIIGEKPWHIQTNFRPSEGKKPQEITTDRFQRAYQHLLVKQDSGYHFTTEVMDTMSVCRDGLGDGTLYTTVYDLDQGLIYGYFYHDYSEEKAWNLREELAKGDHEIWFEQAFKEDKDFVELKSYITPLNNRNLLKLMLLGLGVILFSGAWYSFRGLWLIIKKKMNWPGYIPGILVSVFAVLLPVLMLFLMKYDAIYFFGFDTNQEGFSLSKIMAWIPLVVGFGTLLMIGTEIQNVRNNRSSIYHTSLIGINALVASVFIGLFFYWGILIP